MVLDAIDEGILRVLGKDGKSTSRTLLEVVQASGFARSTVILHLKRLEAQGFIRRVKITAKRRGRPKYAYSAAPVATATKRVLSSNLHQEIVAIRFQKLRQICRHEKGRFCKLAKKRCEPQNCLPITRPE